MNYRRLWSFLFVAFLGAIVLPCSCTETVEQHQVRQFFPRTDTLRIAFYNVENLFDASFQGTEYDDYSPGTSNWNDYLFEVKVENIASALAAMRADIVGLCEIESFQALNALQKSLAQKGVHYSFKTIADTHSSSAVKCALLSSLPIIAQKTYKVNPANSRPSRDILRCDIQILPDTISLFINHWPSKFHPESHRITAATALKRALMELPANWEYLIAGDFNVNYNEHESLVRSPSRNDTEGRVSLQHVVRTVRNVPGEKIEFCTKAALLDSIGYHYDLWLDLPEPLRRSAVYRGISQTPDHIVLPRSLLDSTGWTYVDSSFQAFTWTGLLMWKQRPYRWQTKYHPRIKRHLGKGYSDHLPIYAEFVRK